MKEKNNLKKQRVRAGIAKVSNRVRLSVFKSNRYIYAQIIDKSNTLASASSLMKDLRMKGKSNCNVETAKKVGSLIGELAEKKGIKEVVFDKGAYKYHGVVKALADSARKKLNF